MSSSAEMDNNISDHQFEFLQVTAPGSPKSPADHLFFNGKLLPHVFPVPSNMISYSRSTSRTSSRDSLMSSRSNSTNSRSSSGGSNSTARNSNGSSCDQANYVYSNSELHRSKVAARGSRLAGSSSRSQKWQFIAAAPVLKHQGSGSRKLQQVDHGDHVLESQRSGKSRNAVKSWFGRRVFNSLSSACKECHGMKTSQVEEEEEPES